MRLVYPSILSHLRSLSCLRKKKTADDNEVSVAVHQLDINHAFETSVRGMERGSKEYDRSTLLYL